MADVALLAGGALPAPLPYVIPGAQEIVVKAATATFDGSAAAAAFVPTLQIVAPNGTVLASCPASSPVAAGASADVSWFPFVGAPASAFPSGEAVLALNARVVGDGAVCNYTYSSSPGVNVGALTSGPQFVLPGVWRIPSGGVIAISILNQEAVPIKAQLFQADVIRLDTGAREVLVGAQHTVAAITADDLPWTTHVSGSVLLDRTTPAEPTVLATALYAVVVTIGIFG